MNTFRRPSGHAKTYDDEVRLRFPLVVRVDAVLPDGVEGELPGRVVTLCGGSDTYAHTNRCAGEAKRQTGGAEDEVELLVLPVFSLNACLHEPFAWTRDELDLL